MEALKTIAAAFLALFFAYGAIKLVGWILGFTISFVLDFAFLVLLCIVALPIYLIIRKMIF
ncbi:MAG: hypothetical protein NZ949_02870 [Candidatus Kapabacteria bacterium]|nr:hypothetical protein [Candidatus Kapabacteria bacterium]MDW7996997.1 hypothetical protein [Bacteroidota bacterium]MDW8225643.1 hypothetical protein [Bacteroidota bacterium]